MLEKLIEMKIDMNDVSVLYLKMEGAKAAFLFPSLPEIKIHSERVGLCNNVFY